MLLPTLLRSPMLKVLPRVDLSSDPAPENWNSPHFYPVLPCSFKPTRDSRLLKALKERRYKPRPMAWECAEPPVEALKGRVKILLGSRRIACPFRALVYCHAYSQAVGLGYYSQPFQGYGETCGIVRVVNLEGRVKESRKSPSSGLQCRLQPAIPATKRSLKAVLQTGPRTSLSYSPGRSRPRLRPGWNSSTVQHAGGRNGASRSPSPAHRTTR